MSNSVVSYYITAMKEQRNLKAISIIRKIFAHACVYFTAASLALYTGGMLLSGLEHTWIPTMQMMYTVFFFSLLFSAVNEAVRSTRMSGVLKVLLHYAATTVIFYVMFILWGGFSSSPSSVLVILLAYTFIHAAFSLFAFLMRYIFSVRKSNSSSYQTQFDKADRKK